jgi:hypothetical protein
MVSASSPAAASFAGDPANPPAFYGYDADYLYFRYRMDADPSSGGGFAQYSWTALMQVPSGNPFQYQYQLSLNGKSDTIEIWHNTTASDVDFSPLFHDDADVQLFSVAYTTDSLARVVPAGTSFNGQPDWFVDFAFPVTTLIAKGVIGSAGDLSRALFFPATSTNPNNYNKSYLNCPFQPGTVLQIAKSVTPTVALPNQATPTPVTYSIDVQNVGARAARGVVVEDNSIPGFLANVAVQVTSDDPDADLSMAISLPVKVPTLGAGRHLTVQISGDATPVCDGTDFVNTASVRATNAFERQASATLGGCVPCTTAADCASDDNACTTETCTTNHVCSHEPVPDCVACTAAADCNDGDPCTTETCNAGVCGTQAVASCSRCTSAADCDDSNPCTDDVCGVSGSCHQTAIEGCTPPGTGGGTGGSTGGGTGSPGAGDRPGGNPSTHVAEVCGDCQDNDGDGLVDYEDPDCCRQIDPLTLARMVMRERPQAARDSLRLRSRAVAGSTSSLNPASDGVTLQLSDANGQLYCHDIALATTKGALKHGVFRFRDRTGTLAAGLQRVRFKIRKDGRIVFRAAGGKMNLRPATDNGLRVTLRVGDLCLQTSATLRSRSMKVGSRSVFP